MTDITSITALKELWYDIKHFKHYASLSDTEFKDFMKFRWYFYSAFLKIALAKLGILIILMLGFFVISVIIMRILI